MSNTSDRELIAAAGQGQAAAFASLIGRYRDVRTRFAIRMLGNYDSADEALQAAFVRAFQSIGRCKTPDQFEDWLFRIVINECRARALRRTVRQRNTGEFDAIADWRAAVEGSQHGADVQRALEQIDPINREAFILQYIEELPYSQIASLTGASVITLERQVDRACSRLRELLPDWQKEQPSTEQGLGAAIDAVGPSFAVRIAMPLRRPEILNESFEDRLMAKLLRSSQMENSEAPLTATTSSSAEPAASAKLEPAPPSPATLPDPPLFGTRISQALPSRLRQPAIALGLTIVAFGAGYALRGRTADRASTSTKAVKTASTKVVRHTDTIRVAKSDTVLLARFVLADPSAKSVALAGDFNRWDASATSLTRTADGSWARTLRLPPGRYEYAYLVDGKRWVADRFARSSHDAFAIESSVLDLTASNVHREDESPAARLKGLLPRVTAQRVLDTIAVARAHGLPAEALENRALKYAVRHVSSNEIEDAIAADADAMTRSSTLLAASTRRDPTAGEVDAAAQLLGEGVDSTSIAALARAAASNRSLEIPLRVSAELVATSNGSNDAMALVAARLRDGASDSQLEHLLDVPPTAVANKGNTKKPSAVAKTSSTTSIRQAGSPSKASAAAKPRHKTSDK